MTDQVSNALSILSYFSSLLDPISTSTSNQNQKCEHSETHDNVIESSSSSPSTSSPSTSSSTTETSSVALNLTAFSTSSLTENFQPVMIGLKFPLSFACTSQLQATGSSADLLTTSTSNTDHQTFFLINPVISPGIGSGQKISCMGNSASQSLTDEIGGQQVLFNESTWSLQDSPGLSTKQSMDSIKSENAFVTRNSSDQNGSTSSSPSWREVEDEHNFQFPCSSLSFTIPFSTTIDSKRYNETQQEQQQCFNVSSLEFDPLTKTTQLPILSPILPGNATLTLNSFQAMNTANGKEEKTCGVCGDRALGCNFDAVSCESCKAFFRRNAFKELKVKCLFDGNCQINVNTRRFCSYCRLKQCFAAGMKKDLILGVEEKRRRMEVVKQNRKRRSDESVSSTTTATGNSTTTTSTTNHITSTEAPSSESTNLLTLAKHDRDPLTSSSSSSVASSSLASSSLTSSVHKSQSSDSQLVRKLTAEESHMLIDLNQVYDLSFTVDLEPLIHITQLNPSLNQLVNQSSYTVLRLIKFAKRLEDFVKLSQDLQISILKGCWFHLLLLRPVSLFDDERDGWITPKGVIPTDILKNATGYVQLHDDHVRYCRSIKSIIGNDIMLLVILLVLVLFAPDGPHVLTREVISNIQDRYVILLKHYLEAKYTFKRSAHMFPQLLEKIRELNSLVENHAKILMDINPQEIEPIMLEMLDFKN